MNSNKKQLFRGIGIGLILSAAIFYSIYFLIGSINNNSEVNKNEEDSLSDLTKKVNEIINTENNNDDNSLKNDDTDSSNSSTNNNTDSSSANDNTNSSSTNSSNTTDTLNNDNEIVSNELDNNLEDSDLNKIEKVNISINYGDSSYDVAITLFNAGLIDNVDDFDKYCIINNKSKYIQIGTFSIPKKSSYDEILDIIAN